jgi:hypothetical protein
MDIESLIKNSEEATWQSVMGKSLNIIQAMDPWLEAPKRAVFSYPRRGFNPNTVTAQPS